MKFTTFLKRVEEAYLTTPGYRYGQALFNELVDVRPDLSERIRGGEDDPFYKKGSNEFDEEMVPTIAFLEANWREHV